MNFRGYRNNVVRGKEFKGKRYDDRKKVFNDKGILLEATKLRRFRDSRIIAMEKRKGKMCFKGNNDVEKEMPSYTCEYLNRGPHKHGRRKSPAHRMLIGNFFWVEI